MDENFKRALRGEPLDGVAVSRMYGSTGELCHISHRLVSQRDETGAVEAVFGALFDVTERTRAEMALIDSEARFRLLAENMSDMVVRIGPKGEVLYTSPAIRRISGYGPEESALKFGRDSIHPDDFAGFIESVTELRRGEMPTGTRLRHRRKRRDGAYVWLEGNPTAVFDENGQLVEIIDVIRDITAQKAMEEELQAARDAAEAASKVKSQFLSNMSHELRTPLTAVLGFSSLLERQPDLSERSLSYVERLSTAGKALLSIINDVLDFSKLEAGRLEMAPRVISPADLIRDAVELFAAEAEGKGVALTVSGLEGLLPRVLADPDRLRQILLNLVGNAVKFTDAGEVCASARYLRHGRLEVTVTDSGPGIARNQRSRLFQRFSQIDGSSTRRHGGSGLGLAICKGLVEAMGGEIGVRSRAGAGASFWFVVPVPAAAEGGLEPAEPAAPVPRRGARVLVVDDHPVNRQLVRAILEPFGVMVEEAGDGRSGVAIACERPFDVILMDMRMPDVDGLSAMTAIRGAEGPNQSAPILAFSAENDDGEALPVGGFDGRLVKPLTASDLLIAVARFTGPRGAAPDLAEEAAA
jgi:PAS domain S-box-containing protein